MTDDPWPLEVSNFYQTAEDLVSLIERYAGFDEVEVTARDSNDTVEVVQFFDVRTRKYARVTITEVLDDEEDTLTAGNREQLTRARDQLVLLGVNAGNAWQVVLQARAVGDAECVTVPVYLGGHTDDNQVKVAEVHGFSDGTIEVRKSATVPGTLGEEL
jgi:hypothetical protein